MSDVPQNRQTGGAALCRESMRVARDDEYDSAAGHEIRKAERSPLSRSPPIGRFQLTLNLILGDRQGLQCAAPDATSCCLGSAPRLGKGGFENITRNGFPRRFGYMLFFKRHSLCLFKNWEQRGLGRWASDVEPQILYWLTCPASQSLSPLERAMFFPTVADHGTTGRQNPTQMCLGGR